MTAVVVISHRDRLIHHRARPTDRVRARLAAGRLDRELAAGRSPDATMLLALRADAIVGPRARRALARSVRRVMVAARQPVGPLGAAVPVCRPTVRAARAELAAYAERLVAPGPISPQAVAAGLVLLADGGGPLYRPGAGAELAARLHAAVEAADRLAPLAGEVTLR